MALVNFDLINIEGLFNVELFCDADIEIFDCSDFIEFIDSWLPDKFFFKFVVVAANFDRVEANCDNFDVAGVLNAEILLIDCCDVVWVLFFNKFESPASFNRWTFNIGANTPYNGSHWKYL